MGYSFNKCSVQCYSNFMKFTISNAIYNLILIILENSTILFIIDLMFQDAILGEVLTPLYFLSPHLYLDILNEQFSNECNKIFTFDSNMNSTNTTDTSDTTETINSTVNATYTSDEMYKQFNTNDETYDIVFFGHTLYQTDNSYCIYSSNLIFIVIGILGVYTVFFVILFFLNTRNKPNIFVRIVASVFTNFINLIVRPFFVVISIVLINRPIVFLYYSNMIKPEYKTEEIIYTVLSLFFLIYGVVFAYIHIKYINNSFYF